MFPATLMLASVVAFVPQSTDVQHVDASTPRDVQIQLARQAAPPEVGREATIYVLGPKGYEKAVEGKNGFSCIIDREFPDTMEPECFDAEGSRTTLQTRLFTEQARAQGKTQQQIGAEVESGYKSGRFRAPQKPGIVYMLSPHNHVFDPDSKKIIHFPGHLMFYAPYATEKEVGSGPGAPYLDHPGKPDALMIVVPASNH
jgi:hypothetical protein